MDEFLILLQAKLDEAKSKENVNADIDKIQSQIDKLKIQATIDPKTISNLVKQLETVLNQKINISNININQSQISKSAQQTGQQIGQQIQQGMNSAIQKGKFKQEFFFSADKQNNVAKQAQQYFNGISNGVVSIQEKMQELDGKSSLQGFVVNIKNAKGEIESLSYSLRNIINDTTGAVTGQMFKYTGGSINDNGVIKQINAISAKADNLQTKLDKLKANYSDVNASRPIKDSSNISALSQQYDKVAQAIENVRNSDNSTFSSMTSNAQKEITTLETMISQFRNAENVATQMKSVDISSGIAQATERLGKLKANASGFDQMTQTIQNLDTALSQVGDKASLDKFINDLRTAEAQLGRVKAEVKSSAEINKIQLSFDTGAYDAKVTDLIAKTNQWTDANGNARISTVALSKALNTLTTAERNLSHSDTATNRQALIDAEKQLDAEIRKVTNDIKEQNAVYAKDSAISSLHNKIQTFYDKNTATHRKWGDQLRKMLAETASGAELTKERVAKISAAFNQVQVSAIQAGKLGLSFFDKLKNGMKSFSYWTSSTFLVMKMIREVKEAFNFAKELDRSLTNINYTMDVTESQLADIGNASINMAKDLKTSASNVLEAVTLYANAKETADSILQKSQTAIMLSNVTGMSGSESAKMLQSVMNQFDLTQDDLTYISDTIQAVSQNMAFDFSEGIKEISSGIERSGSVAKAAGLDLAEYASMLGLVIEKTGQSGDTIGNAYKTIFQRITKASATEGTLEEDISAAEKSLRAVGVEVRDSADSFRDLSDIMKDLGDVWDSLTDVEQSNISYNVAGIRQTNILKTLLGYWTDYENLVTKAGDAAGTTLENQGKYEETLDAKTKKLATTMESFWHNLIGADEANGAIKVLQGVANTLEGISKTFGSLGTIGLGAGLFAGFKNVGVAQL